MTFKTFLAAAMLFVSVGMVSTAGATTISEDMQRIQSAWANAKYEQHGQAQFDAFESVLSQIQAARTTHPQDLNLKVWEATTLSSYASAKGGLPALKLVKKARKLLEESLSSSADFEERAFAHAVLGLMYAKVPGKPVAFKNIKKAKAHFEQAMALAPHDMDVHFYYGEFCMLQKERAKAKHHFNVAKEALPAAHHIAEMTTGRLIEIEHGLKG